MKWLVAIGVMFECWVILLLVEAGIARWRDQKLDRRVKQLEDKLKRITNA